jgi:hypothetical protein
MGGDYSVREGVRQMGLDEVPVSEIVKATGVTRNTVIRWLLSDDITPKLKRGEKTRETAASLKNIPVALSIEEGVRRRLAAQEAEEDDVPAT